LAALLRRRKRHESLLRTASIVQCHRSASTGFFAGQWTMFFDDPFGNLIEIKGVRSFETLYAA